MNISTQYKIKGSVTVCNICKKADPKYKCPRCLLRSCSMDCSKNHKIQHHCSGLRNRCKQIDKKDMDNLQLSCDYRFLMEVDERMVKAAEEKEKRNLGRTEMFKNLPKHLQKLRIEAYKRGTVLEFMAKNFSKRLENSSMFNFKSKNIWWHTKWVFDQANVTFIEKSINEETKIYDIIEKYMEPKERYSEDDNLESLAYYHSATNTGICVLLRTQLGKFIEMTPNKSLRLNFANQKIVEYPEFYVVLKIHLNSYIESFKELPLVAIEPTSTKTKFEKNPLDYCNDQDSSEDEF